MPAHMTPPKKRQAAAHQSLLAEKRRSALFPLAATCQPTSTTFTANMEPLAPLTESKLSLVEKEPLPRLHALLAWAQVPPCCLVSFSVMTSSAQQGVFSGWYAVKRAAAGTDPRGREERKPHLSARTSVSVMLTKNAENPIFVHTTPFCAANTQPS